MSALPTIIDPEPTNQGFDEKSMPKATAMIHTPIASRISASPEQRASHALMLEDAASPGVWQEYAVTGLPKTAGAS